MKPHLTTSPIPATSSARGSVRSRARSQSTPAGSWKEPTRFLPAPVFMPVLPPTAASTMASSVVGTCTTRTPRSQVAATKPPRSVVAPPPNVTTASDRVKPASPSASQQLDRDRGGLGLLAVGDREGDDVVVGAAARRGRRATGSASASEWITATRCADVADQVRQPRGQVVADHDVVRRRSADVQHRLAHCAYA